MKLWNNLNVRGFLISKVAILKSTHLINIYFFWKSLSKNLLWTNNHNLALIIAEKFTKSSQNRLTLFLDITAYYQQIKILPLW